MKEVTVSIRLPKAVHHLVTKLAAVEGSTVNEWYVEWIERELQALLGDAHDVFDIDHLIEANGLREIVGER